LAQAIREPVLSDVRTIIRPSAGMMTARLIIASFVLRLLDPCAAFVQVAQRLTQGIPQSQPRLFITVLSAWDYTSRRAIFRNAWKTANLGKRYKIKFAICVDGQAVAPPLEHEANKFDDIIFLACAEGVNGGRLSQKVLASMNAFHQLSYYNFLMLVEDDTFVAWHRLRRFLQVQQATWGEKHGNAPFETAYVGIATQERRVVDRDSTSPWYQSDTVYEAETYPIYMERLGFILGRDIVRGIVENNIGEARMLSNAEQAVGVWVDTLKKRGVPVRYVKLPGRSVDEPDGDHCNTTWQEYQFILQHGMLDKDHQCLSEIDSMNNNSTRIGHCFYRCRISL